LIPIVESKYFTIPILSSAWTILSNVYVDSHIIISLDTLIVYLAKLTTKINKTEFVLKFKQEQLDQFRTSIEAATTADSELVITEVQEFCKQAAGLILVSECVDPIMNNQFDSVYQKFQEFFQKDFSQVHRGLDFFTEIGKLYIDGKELTRDGVIPTGLDELDATCGGGLAKKELGLAIGPSGRGKSALLLNFAYNAIMRNKSVLYLSCELSEVALGQRMAHITMGSVNSVEQFLPIDLIRTLREIAKSTKSKLRIKDYAPGELTVPMIQSYVKSEEARNEKFDLIIVDYLGEMKLPPGERDDIQYKNLATQLRGLAYKLEVPIWTAHQTTRGSHDKMILMQDSISDSFAILRVPDIALTLSATPIEFAAGYQRLTFVKNRFGPTEKTVVVRFNGATQKFQSGDAESMVVAAKKKAKELLDKGHL
jgi:replicative DNA helicase